MVGYFKRIGRKIKRLQHYLKKKSKSKKSKIRYGPVKQNVRNKLDIQIAFDC